MSLIPFRHVFNVFSPSRPYRSCAISPITDPMTDTLPPCPECASEFTYEVDALLNCPSCGHEWSGSAQDDVIKDAVGNPLADGDTVTVVKDLKIKGAGGGIKVGTKVKNIRLVDPDTNNGHDITCKVPGHGPMSLKSSVVKKG